MRSQGLPFPFYRYIWALTIHPPSPLAVLRDGFTSAGISRRGSPARHLANPRSSCSRCGAECLSPPVSAILIKLPSLDLLTSVSLPHRRDTCCMLRVSAERDDGVSPSSQRPYYSQTTNAGELRVCAMLTENGIRRVDLARV
jgi:hypothetical protein